MKQTFRMMEWIRRSNIYEVNVRQYTAEGSFMAFAKHIPRLHAMGVDVLWFMPVTPISLKKRQGSLGSYYACSSYTTVNPEFGSLDDFKTIVQQAHALGMKVIIDWVANHTGWDHHWTVEHPDWYIRDGNGEFTERNGWHDVIDLDYASTGMRNAMINAMQYWVKECNIDGFRCDMAHLVPLDFWRTAKQQCDNLKPLYWLGECEVTAYHEVFNTTYAWAWMHATEHAKNAAGLQEVQQVLHGYTQYPEGATKLFFTSNHDENSWNGTAYEKYGIAALAWAVFTATWQGGVPLIYSGQEAANKKRLKFFDKDMIEWQYPPKLESFYAALLKLRKTSKAIGEGETFILPSEHNNQLLAYLRKKDEETILVLLNISTENKLKIGVTHEWLSGSFQNLFSEMRFVFNGYETFELQAGEYMIYRKI